MTTKTPAVRKARSKKSAARMEYMNHDRVGIINMRRAVTRDVKQDVLRSADRAFALAFDFMQNSGWIAGAADQIISDMIGTELKLNARPDLSRLGYSDAERAAWCRLVENDWRRIENGELNSYHSALYQDYFCANKMPQGTTRQILENIKFHRTAMSQLR